MDKVTCMYCKGAGGWINPDEQWDECYDCEGTGEVEDD